MGNDEKNFTKEFLKKIDFLQKQSDTGIAIIVGRILQSHFRNPKSAYTVNDIRLIIEDVEKALKALNNQQFQQILTSSSSLFQNFGLELKMGSPSLSEQRISVQEKKIQTLMNELAVLKEQNALLQKQNKEIPQEDTSILKETISQQHLAIIQIEEENSRLTTTNESLNEQLYNALLNKQELEDSFQNLKTQLANALNRVGDIDEKTIMPILRTLSSTDSEEIRFLKSRIVESEQEKERITKDISALDKALQDLKIKYYEALEKIESQNQEISEVLQENTQLRDFVNGKQIVRPLKPILTSNKKKIEFKSYSSPSVSTSTPAISSISQKDDDNLLSLAEKLENRLSKALSSFEELSQETKPKFTSESSTLEKPLVKVESTTEFKPISPIENSANLPLERKIKTQTPLLSEDKIETTIGTSILDSDDSHSNNSAERVYFKPSKDILFPPPDFSLEVNSEVSEVEKTSAKQQLKTEEEQIISGTLNELYAEAPEIPKISNDIETVDVLEKRFEEMFSIKNPESKSLLDKIPQIPENESVQGNLGELSFKESQESAKDGNGILPDKFSKIYEEIDQNSPASDFRDVVMEESKVYDLIEPPMIGGKNSSIFEWDPLATSSSEDNMKSTMNFALRTEKSKQISLAIFDKGKSPIIGIDKKIAKALRKHFGVEKVPDLIFLDPNEVTRKLKKISSEEVERWRDQAKRLLEME